MKIGIEYEITRIVESQHTASAIKSGAVDVLATPIMIAFMEEAAMELAAPHLEEGYTTVGTVVNIMHNLPTAVGKQVTSCAVLTGAEGRKLSFSVEVICDGVIVGQGKHERAIINLEKFMQKIRC